MLKIFKKVILTETEFNNLLLKNVDHKVVADYIVDNDQFVGHLRDALKFYIRKLRYEDEGGVYENPALISDYCWILGELKPIIKFIINKPKFLKTFISEINKYQIKSGKK